MSALSERTAFFSGVAVSLEKGGSANAPASIDRQLIDFLLVIESTGSVSEACERLNCSTRHAQRMLRRFTDGSGLVLLEHHGSRGTTLSGDARRCIALYAALNQCAENLLKEYPCRGLCCLPTRQEAIKTVESPQQPLHKPIVLIGDELKCQTT